MATATAAATTNVAHVSSIPQLESYLATILSKDDAKAKASARINVVSKAIAIVCQTVLQLLKEFELGSMIKWVIGIVGVYYAAKVIIKALDVWSKHQQRNMKSSEKKKS